MAQFILLLHQRPSSAADVSPEQIQGIIAEYRGWSERMGAAGKVVGGQKLTNDTGKVLRQGNGGVQVTDGPYGESNEALGGYFLVEAADYAEAAETAGSCPHIGYGGTIELRQIDAM